LILGRFFCAVHPGGG